ncbi:MAG TPA: NAD/NADP octopine/nopaline dehydrogenase family protein [Trinickia sp.]|uniref:NAD/NADP-dependent octopine/nopaline dehydrogenase family protein n=1 Tax=Trinickia sp. TaxID=2571163 RepID=UPI002BAED865|nr:NAD/NADP octopine/nopaline dehydrogenase family protein [Trinickia sp.]HTI18032.1 NAD/NADP octopine/nopaline dehydrogenase family protein [Trinickia sp.]
MSFSNSTRLTLDTEPAPLLNMTICGGGRTGHLSAVLFKQRPGVRVSLLTSRRDVVARYHAAGRRMAAILPDGARHMAELDVVTTDPAESLCDADVVIVTVPAHARGSLLQRIAAHLPSGKPVFVGAIPGFCGFDWLADHTLGHLQNVVIWGMKDVAHTAFDLEPGISVRMGGAKRTLHVATHARESEASNRTLFAHLRQLYDSPVEQLHHYLEITLTPGNPIMHGSVIYGLIGPYGQWHGTPLQKPLRWWTDCPELGAYFIERCDEENQHLCEALERRLGIALSSVKPLKEEIVAAYGDQIRDHRTMLSVLRTNRAYDSIPAPLVPDTKGKGYFIDRESRAFHEDVAYGLALLVEMGRRLDLHLPHIEAIYRWNVTYMGGLRSSALDYFPRIWPA